MDYEKIVEAARREAFRSTYKFRLGSIIHFRGVIAGRGYNEPRKTHPDAPTPYWTRCAEFNAYLDALRRGCDIDDFRRAEIYTHRIKKDGSPGLAKPCKWCEEFIARIGIKKVEYSKG